MDYKEILEGVVDIINTTEKSDIGFANICTYIGEKCPELKENEDERIRKEIIEYIKTGTYHKSWIAWLEKQKSVAETVKKCKDSWYNEGKIDGQAEGLTADEKYWQGWHDALEKQCEQKHVDDKVEPKFHEGDIIKPKNDYRPYCQIIQVDVSNRKYRFDDGYVINFSQEDAFELVKRKPVDKTKPKFHVGDWIVYTEDEDEKNGLAYTPKKVIEFYDNKVKVVDTNGDYLVFPKSELKYYHLWSIADAQDGDILAEDSCIFIIQKFGDNSTFGTSAKTYCTLYNDGDFDDGSILYFDIDSTKPATKEQRDILLKKITEEGHEWDVEKKELKKLEKQYNPNFKIGDWIVCEKFACEELDTAKIVNIEGDKYEVEFIDGSKASPHIDYIDSLYHLWSIDDAKDGDVLVCEGCEYLLFKSFSSIDNRIKLYGWYNEQTNNFHFGADVKLNQKANILPASREQRGLFFYKMNEEGYTWDAEKKELNKREFNPDDLIAEAYQQQADDLIDMVTKKPAWSEEDEKNLQGVIDEIQANKSNAPEYDLKTYDRFLSWLKTIKDRIQHQLKQGGWSEEDDREVKRIIGLLEGWLSTFKETCYAEDCKCGVVWLKSIKERVHPKPQWTEEDEIGFGDTLWAINKARAIAKDENDMGNLWYAENWLKELKERIGG